MKASARIQAVIDVITIIDDTEIPMDKIIGDYMRNRKYIGSKDRAYIAENIYSVTRAKAKISWWLGQAKTEKSPRNKIICFLAKINKLDEDAMISLFDGSKYAPKELTDEEKTYINLLIKIDDESMSDAVKYECPAQHEEALKKLWKDGFANELIAMLSPAPLDLRVNIFLCDRENVKKLLLKDKAEMENTPMSPWGIRVFNKLFLSKTKAFIKGFVEIQDEGSQLISFLCDAKPGMQVLDYCAGGGGKTLGLAMAMKKKGRIVAMDITERRLEKSKARFKRARVSDIIEPRPLSIEKNRKWLRRQKGTFDIALLDVPCSGTGTWRRNPDLRWRNYGTPLDELIVIQAEIMDKVAHTIKKGGRLVYATCSLLPEENENQIRSFLKRHDDFELLPIKQAWPKGFDCPFECNYMHLSPYKHKTDGFFAAVLVKK